MTTSGLNAPLTRRGFLRLSGFAAFLAACGPSVPPQATRSQAATPGPPGLQPTPTSVPPGGVSLAFLGGTILTMEASRPTAAALAVDGDRIVEVGDDAAVRARIGTNTVVVDLAGRTLLPAFVDAHTHYLEHGLLDTDDAATYLDLAFENGVVTIGEAGLTPDHLDRVRDLVASGRALPRMNVYLKVDDPCGESQGAWWKEVAPTQDLDAPFRIAGAKVWTDGGACNRPARSYPYPDGSLGDLYFTPKTLRPMLADADRLGHQIVLHAIGDRAVAVAKDALRDLLEGRPNPLRHRIDHNAILTPDLLPGYAESGGVAVIFGAFQTCAYLGRDTRFKYLPTPEQLVHEWPWRDLLDANPEVHVGWHTDYPVFGPESLLHLYGFVTRRQVWTDGSICEPTPELARGAITVHEALRAMTIGAAYALRREHQLGSLVEGKLADLVILSDDPTAIPPDDLKDVAVLATVLGGRAVHGSGPFADLPARTSGSRSPAPTAVASGIPPAGGGSNLALGAPVRASAHLPEAPAANAVDGSPESVWNSGAPPVQWIEIDLGDARAIGGIRLLVAQYPAGMTDTRIYGRASKSGAESELRRFTRNTRDGDLLIATPPEPWTNVRFVRVEVVTSPSWIAFREIEILAPQ